MGKTRYRFRVQNVDPLVNNHGSWNSPIYLGSFRDKVTTFIGGVPHESWGSPYSPQSYSPDNSAIVVEQIWDELHKRARRKTTDFSDGVPLYNEGGPMLSVKIDTGIPFQGTVGGGTYYNVSGSKRYEGGFMPPPNSAWGVGWAGSPLSYTGSSNALLLDVAPYFDRAWRMAKPKLEFAGLYVFLKEMGDVVPMLATSAKAFGLDWSKSFETARNKTFGVNLSSRKMEKTDLAEHFLNHHFGWAPFLGDLRNFYETYLDASRIIKQITDENGKWVRKKVKVQKDEESVVIQEVQLPINSTSYSFPCFPVGFPADFFTKPPSWSIVETTSTSISASGKFRFYRPEFDITLPDYGSAWNQVMRYVKIYGLEVSPYHIWQATPWSWLVDWVSNLGSYIQRLSDLVEDDVAAAYFFITSHKRIERTMTINLPFASGVKTLVFQRSYTEKQRVSADSPYGIRLSWDELSPKRLAILGALGITRNSSGGRGL